MTNLPREIVWEGSPSVATQTSKKKSDYGPIYKGHEGQYSWLFHRVTGVAIILFLFAHVVDTALVGWGPEAYNRVVSVYHNPFIRLLELGLVAAVIYHALNGLRIMVIDFFPNWRISTTGHGIITVGPVPGEHGVTSRCSWAARSSTYQRPLPDGRRDPPRGHPRRPPAERRSSTSRLGAPDPPGAA